MIKYKFINIIFIILYIFSSPTIAQEPGSYKQDEINGTIQSMKKAKTINKQAYYAAKVARLYQKDVKNYKKALEWYKYSTEINDESWYREHSYLGMIDCNIKLKDQDGMNTAIKKYIDFHNRHNSKYKYANFSYLQIGYTFHFNKLYDAAIKYYNFGLSKTFKGEDLYYTALARSYLANKNYEKVKEVSQKCLEVVPNNLKDTCSASLMKIPKEFR